MKKGWEYKTLKEVSIIYGNYGLSVSSIPYNGVRYLRITDITENGNLNDDKVSADISGGKTQEELQEGDILFARTGATVGKTLIYKKEFGKCLFAGYLIRYRLNKDIVIPQFIHHFTHSSGYYKWVSSNQKAAAQPNIGAKIYNELRIPIPPLSEQKEIVEYLDSSFAKIDKLKENAAKNLEEAKALFQSALKDALEPKERWEEKTLKEIGEIKVGPFGSLLHKRDYILGGTPLINPMHIINGRIYADDSFTISQNKCDELSSYIMKTDDIVIGRRGEIGRCAVVGITENGYICGTGSMFFRPNKNKINSTYLQLLLSSNFTKKKLEAISGGATMKNLSSTALGKFVIQIPPLAEQQSIVSFLDSLNEKVNTLQQNYSRICDECDALKQAILRQVFE